MHEELGLLPFSPYIVYTAAIASETSESACFRLACWEQVVE